jgi:hypothetical protein
MNWVSHPNITALVYAGAPGEQTGPSIVDMYVPYVSLQILSNMPRFQSVWRL